MKLIKFLLENVNQTILNLQKSFESIDARDGRVLQTLCGKVIENSNNYDQIDYAIDIIDILCSCDPRSMYYVNFRTKRLTAKSNWAILNHLALQWRKYFVISDNCNDSNLNINSMEQNQRCNIVDSVVINALSFQLLNNVSEYNMDAINFLLDIVARCCKNMAENRSKYANCLFNLAMAHGKPNCDENQNIAIIIDKIVTKLKANQIIEDLVHTSIQKYMNNSCTDFDLIEWFINNFDYALRNKIFEIQYKLDSEKPKFMKILTMLTKHNLSQSSVKIAYNAIYSVDVPKDTNISLSNDHVAVGRKDLRETNQKFYVKYDIRVGANTDFNRKMRGYVQTRPMASVLLGHALSIAIKYNSNFDKVSRYSYRDNEYDIIIHGPEHSRGPLKNPISIYVVESSDATEYYLYDNVKKHYRIIKSCWIGGCAKIYSQTDNLEVKIQCQSQQFVETQEYSVLQWHNKGWYVQKEFVDDKSKKEYKIVTFLADEHDGDWTSAVLRNVKTGEYKVSWLQA